MNHINELIDTLKQQGITDPAVIEAIRSIPREAFVLSHLKNRAYDNTALPIHCDQTISQPYIVALMTQTLLSHPHPKKILEIGTGSGYQTAILAKLFNHIWTIERIPALFQAAKTKLSRLGFHNISLQCGDGYQGWQKHAPYDGIIVTAAAKSLPRELLSQLSPKGGLMVIPIGGVHKVQNLTLVKKQDHEITQTVIESVCFVPLIKDV